MPEVLEFALGDGGDLLTSAVARAAALTRARERCKGVLAPAKAWRRPDGVVTTSFRVAPGVSLAEVRAAGPLPVGECITVGVGLAEALAAMHAERLAHGAVSAASVLVDGRRVTLIDTMGALSEPRAADGRASPMLADGASPAGDVFALGALLRSLADERATPIIAAWTAPLVDPSETARPTAAHAAAALARCAPSEPVRAPQQAVAAAMRAGAMDRTAPHPLDRWWRLERRAIRLSPVVALAVVAAVSGLALVPAVAGAPELRPLRAHPSSMPATVPVAEAALVDPEAAAEHLAARRIAALAAGDGAAVLGVTVAGSDAARADRELARQIDAGEVVFDGLHLKDVDARLETLVPGGAVVEVTTTLSGYGVGPERQPAGTATARLKLALTQRGWLVERILPPA